MSTYISYTHSDIVCCVNFTYICNIYRYVCDKKHVIYVSRLVVLTLQLYETSHKLCYVFYLDIKYNAGHLRIQITYVMFLVSFYVWKKVYIHTTERHHMFFEWTSGHFLCLFCFLLHFSRLLALCSFATLPPLSPLAPLPLKPLWPFATLPLWPIPPWPLCPSPPEPLSPFAP